MATQTLPKWLSDALASCSKGKYKGRNWLQMSTLPACVLDGFTLSPSQSETLIAAMSESKPEKLSPLLLAIKNARVFCDDFIWRMFEQWEAAGSPTKDKFIVLAVAILSSDNYVYRLSGRFAEWRKKKLYDRAKFGIDCLVANGGNVALSLVDEISHSLEYKSMQSHAFVVISELAKKQGLSITEFEDRIIPTFDSNSSDGLLQHDINQLNIKRLENMLVTERKWSWEQFDTYVLKQPVMLPLSRRLLWATYSEAGQLEHCFHIAEGENPVCQNPDGIEVQAASAHSIGIVHPLFLSSAEIHVWTDFFKQRKICFLFKQLDRAVFSLEAGEDSASELTRLSDGTKKGRKLLQSFNKLDWQTGYGRGFYSVSYQVKHLPALNLTAVVKLTPGMFDESDSEPQGYDCLYFQNGLRKSDLHFVDERIALRNISPVLISELVANLAAAMVD